MSDDVDPAVDLDDEERKPLSWKVVAAAAVLLVLFGLILFGGVRGCATESAQDVAKREEKEKKEKKEKDKEKKEQEDPKIDFPVVLPNETGIADQFVKPGHWALASQKMQARERDFVGHTQTEVLNDSSSFMIPNTPFTLQSTRPVALPKASTKFVQSTFYVPAASEKLTLAVKFDEGGLGFTRDRAAPLRILLPHQYHFVVLAKEPDRYALVKSLDAVQTVYGGEEGHQNYMGGGLDANEIGTLGRSVQYKVELVEAGRNVPLPDNPLMWTTISYLLWDEVDPEPFTPEQEKALVDWLHWGGQLIVNGPDSLDLIKGSFLEPFMPATNGGTREIGASDLRTFNENWNISTEKFPGAPIAPVSPWSGITLQPTTAADKTLFESTGGLLIERPVGRGRVVVSAMQLSERDLVNWKWGFNSWFNACLMRRPPRVYTQVAIGTASLLWDTSIDPSLKDRRLDATLNTALRYFARDLGVETSYRWVQPQDDPNLNNVSAGRRTAASAGDSNREYQPPAAAGGLGAWSDFNLTAAAARGALREAAGVDVPNRAFVVGCLAAYLFVLVPVNWIIFKMLGRVEWAWIAAPIIAIIGTYIVVQRAQLDIGFVRSQTEIGLLELQPNHARGHLSRYTALYTSLSTTYDVAFNDPTALAMPFPNEANPNLRNQVRSTIQFERQGEGTRMTGLPVLSNSTNFVHSEQMYPLDGAIRIGKSSATGGWQLENLSQLRLQGVGIVRKESDGLHGVWIGELGPKQSAAIQDPSRLPSLADPSAPFSIERTAEAKQMKGPRLNLEPLLKLAYEAGNIDAGETRLVARVEDPLAGESVSPEASQLRTGTLVVAHLAYAPPPLPRHDVNTRQDVRIDRED